MSISTSKYKTISKLDDFSFVHKWYELADEDHFWMRWRLRAFLNQAKYLKISKDRSLRGLEVGCGHGVFRKQIECETNWTVDGTDLDCRALEQNPQCRGETYAYDIMEKNLDFKEKYDFIFLFDVLEHIEQPIVFLEACLFHLKKDGYIYVNVPALQFLFSPYDIVVGHFRRYNKQILSDELLQSELQIDNIQYWGFSIIGLLFLRKLFLSPKLKHEDIIQRGFKPPGKFMNFLLCMLMNIETFLIKQPPLGTSVMAAAKKSLSAVDLLEGKKE